LAWKCKNICIDNIQKGPLPLFEKNEIIANSRALWTRLLENLKIFLKISLKTFKNLIKFTNVSQIKSKPHLTLRPDGRIRGRGFKTGFFQK
jgi:hypothetical protein